MLPSSSRKKLNRTALTNFSLTLVPRSRRNLQNNFATEKPEENKLVPEPKDSNSFQNNNASVPSSLTSPANVTKTIEGEPEEPCVGTQKSKWRSKGDGSVHVIDQEGPCTRGKFQKCKPNTRSKSKHGVRTLKELCNLRLKFTWCDCTAADKKEVVKPKRGKMSCKKDLINEATKSKKSGVVKSGRCNSTQGGVNGKTRVGRRARDSGCKEKAKSAWCDPDPAAAQTGTRCSITAELSNDDEITLPSPARLAGSDGSLGKAAKSSVCSLCGDCKYISRHHTTLGEHWQKSSSCGPEHPTVKVENNKKATATSKKIIIWIDQYPKVMLCDIAKKREMRAGFSFEPGCLGHNKQEIKESVSAKEVQSVCRAPSPTEHQSHRTNEKTVSSHKRCRSLKSKSSTTCSASSSLREHTQEGQCRTRIHGRDVEEDPSSRSNLVGEEIHRDKRLKLGHGVKDGTLPSTPYFENVTDKDQAETDSVDKEMSVVSRACVERAVCDSSCFGPAEKENNVHNRPCDEKDNPTNTEAAEMSSEVFSETNEVEMEELDSFTCQRARPYIRNIQYSCARTFMSWPFPNSRLIPKPHTTDCQAEPIDLSARNNSNAPSDQIEPGISSKWTNDELPHSEASSITAHHVSIQKEDKREENGESILKERNVSSLSTEFASHLMEAEEPSLSLDKATFSKPSQRGKETQTDIVLAASSPVDRPEPDSSTLTPSPSALGLSDCETANTLSPMSSLFSHSGPSSLPATPSSLTLSSFLLKKVEAVESAYSPCTSSTPKCMVKAGYKEVFTCEESQITSWTSPSAPSHNSDSFDSCQSSLLLPQVEQESDEELLTHKTDSNVIMLPQILSPINSPQGKSRKSLLPPQSQDCPGDAKEDQHMDSSKRQVLPECHMPEIVNCNNENSKDDLEHNRKDLEGVSKATPKEVESSPYNNEDVEDANEEESQDETDNEDDVEQGNNKSDQVPSEAKRKASITSGALTEPCSSPSCDEDDDGSLSDEGQPSPIGKEGSSPSEVAGSDRDKSVEEDTQPSVLDDITAYEQDILLVDMIQDDFELFEKLPQERVLKLGPTRVTEAPKHRPVGVVKTLTPRIGGASLEFKEESSSVDTYDGSTDVTEQESRTWRPQCSRNPAPTQSSTWPSTEYTSLPDANNNLVNRVLERSQPIQTVKSLQNNFPPLMTARIGPLIKNPPNMTEVRCHKSKSYCRQYFSDSLFCRFKICHFQHVPKAGDEKLCIETVTRFAKKPMCLQKAGAVYTGYYQNNPPGTYFSMPVLLTLLWALLKAGMVSEVFSVLNVSLAHKIVPGPEFLLALFNIVKEKSLTSVVPDLRELTNKMASAGLVLNLNSFDSVKNTPEFQQTVNPNSLVSVPGNHKVSQSAPSPECLNLDDSIVEIELCAKQEDWRKMGNVFRSICQVSKHPHQLGRISRRIATALLSESKDKLSLPFATFAESVCQGEDDLVGSFLGRIGVSLMLRYHKTQQWSKGRRVVDVLSFSKVNYSKLKGLFGNENGASRCSLVTVAAELLLLSGSVEGALNTLRENKWFLGSSLWPCDPADLESRSRVLMRLAGETSHRDTLEVLCNLPGLAELNDTVGIPKYDPLFNSHLQVCVDRQILPVASDTVGFMLSKKLSVDPLLLQTLLNKLGKQNLWPRARRAFSHALSSGYYPEVSTGFMALMVPCSLGEVELALCLEMFVTVSATDIFHLSETSTSCLSITLKRTQNCESEYLSAGSRLLSAACRPLPKLVVHYTAVNSSQDQVFTLDVFSARSWLRHNHLWANEVWTR
ncbi:protein TOPAZ1 isoform X2 [Pseudochaenichthys georgianus]|uniref:protein TOPAZ1 isoform X2 n=1 Tax=Pseudochaenichthys georgianus TaxID=52239 RepID=UPI0039C1CA10